MSSLKLYRNHSRPVDIVGTPILTNDPTPILSVDQTTAGVVFAGFDMGQLTSGSYGFNPKYPLLMKLFCSDVETDSTGEFIVRVTGTAATGNPKIHRQDTRNFGLTWDEKGNTGWQNIASADATVSVQPLAPMTFVRMNCVLGIATDNVDRPEEN